MLKHPFAASSANGIPRGARRAALAAAALIAAAALCFSACSRKPSSKPSGEGSAPEVPAAEYEINNLIRYWPEDADYATCDYACVIEQPVFARTQTAGAAMNLAVEGYLEDLYERVEERYIPASIARPPYTEVRCELIPCGEYTNIVFTEEHFYEAQPFVTTYVLMLDGRGQQVNLNDVLKTYHSDELLAAAIFEKYSDSSELSPGVTAAEIMSRLDISHGCYVDEAGSVRAFFTEGEISPYGMGRFEAEIGASALLPDIGSMSADEYHSLLLMCDRLASACIVRENNVENGALTPYAATAFMGATVQGMGLVSEKGRFSLSGDRFLEIYRNCFANEFPGLDPDAFDVKLTDGGDYSVSASQKVYDYHVDVLELSFEGGVIRVSGDLIYGAYGYAFSAPVCHISLTLSENGASLYGFTVSELKLSL